MYRIFFVFMFLVSMPAYADSINLAIPGSPGSFQSDKFRAGELDCQNAIGSATQLEFGVTGIIEKGTNGYFDDTSNTGDVGVYARITVPLGARVKERINCNDLYEIELRKKRLEVMKLERELEQLRALQFEN